ncbi:MAG: DUF192 domain-containing protein [Bacteroidota bacterium]
MKNKPTPTPFWKDPLKISLLLIGLAIVTFLAWKGMGGTSTEAPEFKKEGELTFYRMDSLGQRQDIVSIDIEMADNTREITQGLMYRDEMEERQGMLFVFRNMESRSFWMKNTLIPLDILFVDDKARIVSIQEGKPLSEQSLPSEQPAKFVVEVNGGFCKQYGIEPGVRVQVKDMR